MMQSLAQGVEKSNTGVLIELEAVAGAMFQIKWFDGVVEPSSCPHNGDGSIAQAVDLLQATRLVARRHQEHIRTCFDEVRPPVVVRHHHTDAPGKIGCE